MPRNYTDNTTPQKGMFQDIHPNNQPEGTYRFALNAVDMGTEGELGFLATEEGNISYYTLTTGYTLIGTLPLMDDEVLLISTNNARGELGIGDKFGNYTVLINSSDFDFTVTEQTQGIVSTVNGCHRKVYFRAPKLWAINIDDLEQYLDAGETVASANASGTGWNVALMKWFPSYTIPTFNSITVNDTGGDLPLGTYQVITTYLDAGLNEIGWMDMSHPIPIPNEGFNGDYDELDGGTNAIYPPTQKSITVEFDNLDESFSYLRIALVASNDGVRTPYRIIDFPITGSTLSYTITSISLANIIELIITDLVVSKIIYEEAQTVTQINNRALLGNVKEKQLDYATYQQAANTIQSYWFAKQVETTSTTPNVKSADYFLDYKGYMSDEVYAFGIVYYFRDGYITPVFHIPSREIDTSFDGTVMPLGDPNTHNRPAATTGWDSSEYTVGVDIDLEDTKHLGFVTGAEDIGYGAGLVPRWLVFNTATRFAPIVGSIYSGELAYWESELDYPSTLDCNGNRIYPEGKIRYHKLPDVTLVPHNTFSDVTNTYTTYPLGIKFTNITYPSNDIIGHKIVRVKRNASNSSVVDKGMFARTILNGNRDLYVQTYPYNGTRSAGPVYTDDTIQCFHSPLTKFNRNALGASHIKIDQKLATAVFPAGEWVDYTTADGAVGVPNTSEQFRSQARFRIGDGNVTYMPSLTNRLVNTQAFIDSDTVLNNVLPYQFDNTEQQEVFVFETEDTLPDPNTEVLMSGYTETNPVYFYYGAAKKHLTQQYGFPNDNTYISCTSSYETGTSSEIYGGDTFISRLYFRKCARMQEETFGGENVAYPASTPTAVDSIEKHLLSFYVESTINVGYRHEGEATSEIYFPKSYTYTVDDFINLEVTLDISGSGIDDPLISNYYAYNIDYSQENDVKVYFMLSTAFEFCYDCNNEYPTRIAYSEVKTAQGTADSWIVFKSNNYRDLPQNKGDITNLFIQDYNVYAHTEYTLFKINTNTQQVNTTENTITIGTGEFFALEPIELKSINEGYLGSTAQWATISTEFGTIFVSNDKVFLLQDSLIEISNLGLRQFFIDNKLKFPDQFKDLSGLDYANSDNTANLDGVGFISCFDRKRNRYLLHKRDYKILFDFIVYDDEPIEASIGDIIWNVEEERFEIIVNGIGFGGTITVTESDPISFDDEEYFQNLSYTISFDAVFKHWVSFHSYLPNFMFNTYSRHFTALSTTRGEASLTYLHNEGLYRHFYGTYKPHIIELVLTENVVVSSVTKSIAYVSHARKLNSTYNQWLDDTFKTFNRIWLYNTTQSSNYLDIVVANNHTNPFISTVYNSSTILAFKAEGTWKLNRFVDLVTNTSIPFSTAQWTDLSSTYFIDKLPNALAHNYAKSFYEYSKLRDKFLITRLIHDTTATDTDYRLVTQYLFAEQKYSNR